MKADTGWCSLQCREWARLLAGWAPMLLKKQLAEKLLAGCANKAAFADLKGELIIVARQLIPPHQHRCQRY